MTNTDLLWPLWQLSTIMRTRFPPAAAPTLSMLVKSTSLRPPNCLHRNRYPKSNLPMVQNGMTAALTVPGVENMLTALSRPHERMSRPEANKRPSTMRCKSTNGADVSSTKTNDTVILGVPPEDQPVHVQSTNQVDESPSLTRVDETPMEELQEDLHANTDESVEGFATMGETVEAIKGGKFVVIVDDESREGEGALIMAGSLVTPRAMAFLVKHTTGIVCMAMKGEDLDRLQLPLMVQQQQNVGWNRTGFTWSVDAKNGTTTGVSAMDRCETIKALASQDSTPSDFVAPGHVFPSRYCEGGVLKRWGHTEAAIDVATLAGLPPNAVLCKIVNEEDGSMAQLPYLKKFAELHDLRIISIGALLKYQKESKRKLWVTRTASTRLPTEFGEFQFYSYLSNDGLEHAAIVAGDISSGLNIHVRLHSECLTGDVFHCTRCDCGSQLVNSLMFINKMKRGVIVYMRGHEGRGIGLGKKMMAYDLQDAGFDTVEANIQLGLPVDLREYGIGAQMLQDLGIKTITLLSNNPDKVKALEELGITVNERRSIFCPPTKENWRYLETKRIKMGNMYTSRLPAVGVRHDIRYEDK